MENNDLNKIIVQRINTYDIKGIFLRINCPNCLTCQLNTLIELKTLKLDLQLQPLTKLFVLLVLSIKNFSILNRKPKPMKLTQFFKRTNY